MAEVTLSDYVGYIFAEIVRARELADRESKRIAEIYEKDEVLRRFSVPRFKIPEMDLTIPVLVSGAKFSNTVSLVLERDAFRELLQAKINFVIRTILIRKRPVVFGGIFKPIDLNIPIKRVAAARAADNGKDPVDEFYDQLVANPDPLHPESIIQDKWYEVFALRLQDAKLQEDYNKLFPNNDLYNQTLAEITEQVKASTVIAASRIQNLLVNPETNVVKNGSSDSSVFVVKAKITEEGLFVHTVKEGNGEEKKVVEFE
ncbi:hypothetical protein SAMN05444008_11265 [Cnuella takakiae]|uniref:Uncharacterized protein n=1 Tax=Cnuella takakiae TaxID=1302690 RepID=A0A1M5EIS7_9BACT|nr:hypothetical protein [Cnuella takakiae]SHF79193.1 hypothetical protein SAMN05444008_11265 [Cnuella takakiae]